MLQKQQALSEIEEIPNHKLLTQWLNISHFWFLFLLKDFKIKLCFTYSFYPSVNTYQWTVTHLIFLTIKWFLFYFNSFLIYTKWSNYSIDEWNEWLDRWMNVSYLFTCIYNINLSENYSSQKQNFSNIKIRALIAFKKSYFIGT